MTFRGETKKQERPMSKDVGRFSLVRQADAALRENYVSTRWRLGMELATPI
jgi:hypothetical protein